YEGADQHIDEIYFVPTPAWYWGDVTAAAGGAIAAPGSALTSFFNPAGNLQQVFYEGANQHVYQMYFDPNSGWHAQDVTAAAGAPTAASGSALTSFFNPAGNVQQIFYEGANQHVYQMYFDPSSGWHAQDVTAAAGAPIAGSGSALTSFFNPTGNLQQVFYEGTNQHVYQMWFDPTSGWHAQDVTAAAGAPPSSYTFAGGKFTLPQGTSVNLGSLVLVMQGDGNLVLYQNGVALWNTGTWGQNCSANQCFAAFQGDGNFVVYNGSTPLWNSQTGGNPGAQLALSAQLPNYIKISSSNQSTLWFAAQTISGKVLAGASGLPGVAVSLSGTALASIATDSNGNYLFSVPVG